MEHRQRSPCHAGTLPAGTVAPGSVPAPAADRHRNRGTDHHRPRYAPGRTRRSRSHRQRRQKARAAAHHAPPPWPFSFAHLPALPPARPAGSVARHALGVAPPRGKAGKYPGSAGRSTRILRPPPAPGRISTASAAPMTPQPISCTACPLPTASSQQRQTSQQPAPAACTYQQHQRTPQPCRLPAAADQHHPRPPNGPKPAHRGPLPEGSDSLPDRHIDFAV